ncbi:MAG: Unknown protein [uncultured Sulfurovum sp.]|uniref:Uncharacterized protein n=1 Tax=uncultured Sulfurovum sp. TaxID=269237 RepID=A0A6S6TNT7_9BACT|nr:MAG: Unknown protein [uncultured Sulfurovum sp.]
MNKHIMVTLLGLFLGIVLTYFENKTGLTLPDNIIISILIIMLLELLFLSSSISEHSKEIKNVLHDTIVFNKIENPKVKAKIIEISQLILKLDDKRKEQDQDEIFDLFYGRTPDYLHECSVNLEAMLNNGIAAVEKKTKNYWKDYVIKGVKKSLWTTNIPEHQKSYGRTNNPELLDAQNKAIQNNIQITRVFIINKPRVSEKMDNLKDTMKAQHDIGIDVKVLEYKSLEEIYESGKYSVEIGLDFMILDERILYITSIESKNNPQSEVNLTELINHNELLKEAKSFQEIINIRAKPFEEWEKSLIENT